MNKNKNINKFLKKVNKKKTALIKKKNYHLNYLFMPFLFAYFDFK